MLALLFLNSMLSFSTWWPTPGIVPEARLAPEFVWLWLALLAVVAWAKRLSRLLLALFTVAYLLLVLGRYLDVTVPSLFGREINLYWDGAQIPRFLWVSAQDLPWWQSGAVMAAVALLISVALTSAAEGRKPAAGVGTPAPSQPSGKYWPTSAAVPVMSGAAMDVPLIEPA
jgi:hypothetical protein